MLADATLRRPAAQETDCPYKHSSEDIKARQTQVCAACVARADAPRRAGLQHVQAWLLHSRPELVRKARRGAARHVLLLTVCWHPCSRFRHLKQPGPPPTPEQAHMTVTRPGRPGGEVLLRGWGLS